jgi:hypothetical protein
MKKKNAFFFFTSIFLGQSRKVTDENCIIGGQKLHSFSASQTFLYRSYLLRYMKYPATSHTKAQNYIIYSSSFIAKEVGAESLQVCRLYLKISNFWMVSFDRFWAGSQNEGMPKKVYLSICCASFFGRKTVFSLWHPWPLRQLKRPARRDRNQR